MNAYYYCNYSYSTVGFQISGLNTRGDFSLETDEAREVIQFLTRGGAESIVGKLSNGKTFFMIKGIDKKSNGVPEQTAGSRWNISLALSAEMDETADLCACAYFAYTDVIGFGDALMRSLRVDTQTKAGYAIDNEAFLQVPMQAREKFANGGDTQDACAAVPRPLEGQGLTPVLQLLKSQDIRERFSFVALSADLSYFYKMYRIDPSVPVQICLPQDDTEDIKINKKPFKKIPTHQNVIDFLNDEDVRKKIIYGAVAAVVVIGGIKLIKNFSQAERRIVK